MFSQYTERARRVIFFARSGVSEFGGAAIESGHLLLGVLKEDPNLPHRLLNDFSAGRLMREETEASVSLGEALLPASVDLHLSEECKRILGYAREEADRMEHRSVGVEHLVLGILREENCVAAGILTKHGLRLEALRGKPGSTGV